MFLIQDAGWDGGQHPIGRAYSVDLRERVVAAVETGGLSCHGAAAQFGVGVSTAVRWVERLRKTGSVAPSKIGGYKPRAIAGEHRTWLLADQGEGFHSARSGGRTRRARAEGGVVSRIFRTLVWAERCPSLAQAVMAPLICWSFALSIAAIYRSVWTFVHDEKLSFKK